jgi:hypothetical protein
MDPFFMRMHLTNGKSMNKIKDFPNFPGKKPFIDINAVPVWLEGALSPLINPYELGIMTKATALCFIGTLGETDEEIIAQLGVTMDWWKDQRIQFMWAACQASCQGWIKWYNQKSAKGKAAADKRWELEKLKLNNKRSNF